jgi:hypothetical protein
MKHDLEKALNMKLVLCIFEQLLGLKFNFHKSEFFFFALARLRTLKISTRIFSVVSLEPSLLDIWGFQFISVN